MEKTLSARADTGESPIEPKFLKAVKVVPESFLKAVKCVLRCYINQCIVQATHKEVS